jgi:hypothetical protein
VVGNRRSDLSPDHDSFAAAKRPCTRQKNIRPILTWIKPVISALPENSNRTGGATVGRRTGFWEAIMREFLAAAAISALIIGVMLGVG